MWHAWHIHCYCLCGIFIHCDCLVCAYDMFHELLPSSWQHTFIAIACVCAYGMFHELLRCSWQHTFIAIACVCAYGMFHELLRCSWQHTFMAIACVTCVTRHTHSLLLPVWPAWHAIPLHCDCLRVCMNEHSLLLGVCVRVAWLIHVCGVSCVTHVTFVFWTFCTASPARWECL